MARTGRPAKPTILKLLEGNPGKGRLEPIGLQVNGAPFVPEYLREDARGCLDVIVATMPPRFFCPLDSFPLAAYAAMWALHKDAYETVFAPGFPRAVGSRQAPEVRTMIQAAAAMASLGGRLGLDRAARAAIRPPSEPKPRSKFAGLIAGCD